MGNDSLIEKLVNLKRADEHPYATTKDYDEGVDDCIDIIKAMGDAIDRNALESNTGTIATPSPTKPEPPMELIKQLNAALKPYSIHRGSNDENYNFNRGISTAIEVVKSMGEEVVPSLKSQGSRIAALQSGSYAEDSPTNQCEISVTELNQLWLDAQRDDLFDVIVPSDIRRLLAEISRLRQLVPMTAGEISVVDKARSAADEVITHHLSCFEGETLTRLDASTMAWSVYMHLVPYLRTTKPVSIDLELCARALAATYYASHGDCHFNTKEVYCDRSWSSFILDARACLEAAGALYAD